MAALAEQQKFRAAEPYIGPWPDTTSRLRTVKPRKPVFVASTTPLQTHSFLPSCMQRGSGLLDYRVADRQVALLVFCSVRPQKPRFENAMDCEVRYDKSIVPSSALITASMT